MKVAVIHEWFTTWAGSENVVEQILKCFPQADVFALMDFLPETDRPRIAGKRVKTSFLQHLPFARTGYRNYLPLMPFAVEQFDLSAYDLVISSSHAVAKGVRTLRSQVHVCYIHSPMRYAWDLQGQYLRETGLDRGIKGLLARWMLKRLRIWDARTANRVDYFIANSNYIAARVRRAYNRNADVIYPPVDIEAFTLCAEKEDYYVTASRFVPYKKVDVVVEAFAGMPEKRLIVIGDGPDLKRVRAKAGTNVTLLGFQDHENLVRYLQSARAFIFAGEEDFGILPVEAQACGTPVIAYGRGGARESIRGLDDDVPTGMFFMQQSAGAIQAAVADFESIETRFSPAACRYNAERFSALRFRESFKAYVHDVLEGRPKKRIHMQEPAKTALCIPTLNPGRDAVNLIAALAAQILKPAIFLVIDSGSDDGSSEAFSRAGAQAHSIDPREFNHGGTRQLAVDQLDDADFIIFLTQDAIPADPQSFKNLIECFADPEIGAAFGRQLPRNGAGPIEAHARVFNYPASSRITTFSDRARLGIKTTFMSNSFAAYRRADLVAVGGFPSDLIMGEDTYVAAKLLLAGKKVAYCADATVFHSHDYRLMEEFRRYFDAGVLHARQPWIRRNFGGAENEGLRFVKSELGYLFRRNPLLIPSALLRSLYKLVGFQLGLHEDKLTLSLKRRLSMFPPYWADWKASGAQASDRK
jgi:glycosyltransferase involved in cell wall biosynthesis/GT2 family glycosyltransferase